MANSVENKGTKSYCLSRVFPKKSEQPISFSFSYFLLFKMISQLFYTSSSLFISVSCLNFWCQSKSLFYFVFFIKNKWTLSCAELCVSPILFRLIKVLFNIILYIYITFMHVADAFIQSDLQCIQAIHFLSVCVFPGNWTHNLLCC